MTLIIRLMAIDHIHAVTNSKWSSSKVNIPKPDDFSKAIYTFDIGQNDLSYGFQHTHEAQVRASIPQILDNFTQAIHVRSSFFSTGFFLQSHQCSL